MKRSVTLFAASCCLVLGSAAANAESPRLADVELDRVVAGFDTFPPFEAIGGSPPPPPLFAPPSDNPFDIATGLLNPPPPPVIPPVTPPTTPPNAGTPPSTPPPALTIREQLAAESAARRALFR